MPSIFDTQRTVHVMFTDRYFRFLETGKHHSIKRYGQKCLPEGLIQEGIIQDPETLSMIIDHYLIENKIKRVPVYVNLPDGHTIVRKVSVPLEIPFDEIKGYLYMEIGESLHLPFEDPILEVVELETREGANEVLLIAVKESIVQQYVDFLTELKCKPQVMDLSILSLYRLYYHLNLYDPNQHLLQIQIFINSFQLSIFHDHKPIYVRSQVLPESLNYEIQQSRTGFEVYHPSNDENGTMEQIQVISQEVERLINFYRYNMTNGEYQLNAYIVSGDHPFLNSYAKELENQLGISIQSLAQPLFQTDKNMNIPFVLNECIGLSLK
ncbi:type IV pilus biogenesis protein PilM [Falsibacillus pallidus]|uniref:Type IV pilus assembly protein PilM n=1 Tax=Falsibacillus pallidus TaxID=493781 RepID=A0A370GKB6_9BACI|nr:pilus assembly protein PilM [Falsibacillus pallidus]RDI44155.1 type IV pilus assembly protein PilM [Falsibacillus pallidus]